MGFSIKKAFKSVSGAVKDAVKDTSKAGQNVYRQGKQITSSEPFSIVTMGRFVMPTSRTIQNIGKRVGDGVGLVSSTIGTVLGQARALQPAVQQLASQYGQLQGFMSDPLGYNPNQEASMQSPQLYNPQGQTTPEQKDNTTLYIAIAAGVVVLFLIMRKK